MVSKGALYLLFERKEELYLAIAQRCLNDLIERWETIGQVPAMTGFARFRAMVEAYLGYALDHRDRFRVALSWSSSEYAIALDADVFTSQSPAATAYREALQRSLRPGAIALEAGKRDGSVRLDLDVPSTLFHVWSGTVGVLLTIFGAAETSKYLPAAVDYDRLIVDHVAALLQSVRTAPCPEDYPRDLMAQLSKGGGT
jgi:AcrR family transcriptional regulator